MWSFPFLFLVFLPSLVFAQACYWPNGNPVSFASQAYRCDNSTTGHSTCCQPGSKCWSNGVCEKIDQGITDWIRLGCTDPTWQDPACLSVCLNNGSSGLGVRPCDGMAGDRYCCDFKPKDPGNMTCCQNSANIFQWKAASVIATMPLSQVSGSATMKTASTTGTKSTTSTTSVSTTGLTNPPSTGGSQAMNTSSGLSTGTKAGIGVGAGVGGVALLAGLVFLSFRRGQRHGAGVNDAAPPMRGLSWAELSPQGRLQEMSGHPDPVVQEYAAELDRLAGVHELDDSQRRL